MPDEEWDHPVFATREEFEQRVRDVQAQEQEQYVANDWWYLSFASETGFLGGLYLEAQGPMGAIQRAHEIGQNPGGEVRVLGPMPGLELCPKQYLGRLLTEEEIATVDELMIAAFKERGEQ